jgi:hypothetical protein
MRPTGHPFGLWKCEDQAPYIAQQIKRPNIANIEVLIESDKGHTWVMVRDTQTGEVRYIDPWEPMVYSIGLVQTLISARCVCG